MIKAAHSWINDINKVHQLKLLELKEKHSGRSVASDNDPLKNISETALLSEISLAEDWNRPEEDEAWAYLQPVQ